jgi:hypothetical protein
VSRLPEDRSPRADTTLLAAGPDAWIFAAPRAIPGGLALAPRVGEPLSSRSCGRFS